MTRDDYEDECDYLRNVDRAERQERAARARDYAETGYLGPCDECGEDGCLCEEEREAARADYERDCERDREDDERRQSCR